MVGFQLLGEVAVGMADEAWPFMEKFTELGAVRVGDNYLLAIDVSQMVAELQIEGDSLLENPELSSGDARYLLVASATCRRGKQTLRVRLVNDEWTDPVEIGATLMNRVGGFEIRNARQIVEGMKIYGLGPGMADSDPQNRPPDLTPWPVCLDLGVTKPDVVELVRDKTFSVKGVSSGTTDLKVLLIGSAAAPEYTEVSASFPIEVTGTTKVISGKVDMNFYAARWKVNLEYELRALGPAGFTVIKQGQSGFPGTQSVILELQGPAAGSDVQSDQYELRAKVTDIRPLKGQTLEPGYEWMPYLSFNTNNYVKGPEAIYRFSVTRGKVFGGALGLTLYMVYSSTGNGQPMEVDGVLDLAIR
jgi:hypothetical protein